MHVNIDSIFLKIMVYTYKMTFNDFYRICLRSIVGREAAFFSQKDRAEELNRGWAKSNAEHKLSIN